MGSEYFRKRKSEISSTLETTLNDLEKGQAEIRRVRKVLENTPAILDDLDEQFCRKTGLTKIDIGFLFTAIGLQMSRQYLVTKFPERLDDQTAAKKTTGKKKESSNRKHRYYNPSLDQIISNPVPFDANIGANGALEGGGKMGHRVTAIGHDPLIGLVIGTANIATSTLTTSKMKSYHIFTNQNKRDYFKNNAQTRLVLNHTTDKMIKQGMEGKTIVAASLLKEIIHLKSDINTKNSLPLPFISAVDSQLASNLASYGFDMSNLVTIGKQASYTMLINSLIAMIHMLFCRNENEMDRKLYEVRTRKILSYSNLVASSTNIALVTATQNTDLLDLGGIAVTIYRLITDSKFIRQVKEEFIFGKYEQMIMGDYLN